MDTGDLQHIGWICAGCCKVYVLNRCGCGGKKTPIYVPVELAKETQDRIHEKDVSE